jgi:hypothetical protein
MSLLPPAMRDADPMPTALGPVVQKPKEPSAEEQRRAQVLAFERGDHQPDGSVRTLGHAFDAMRAEMYRMCGVLDTGTIEEAFYELMMRGSATLRIRTFLDTTPPLVIDPCVLVAPGQTLPREAVFQNGDSE